MQLSELTKEAFSVNSKLKKVVEAIDVLIKEWESKPNFDALLDLSSAEVALYRLIKKL